MPSIDSKTLSLRISNQLAKQVQEKAASVGLTVNAFLTSIASAAVKGEGVAPEPPTDVEIPGGRLYGVALNLVDDLVDAGYPESEIENALKSIRRDML